MSQKFPGFRFREVLLLVSLTVLLPIALSATSFRAIYVFNTQVSGENPPAGVTLDAAGNLYGTTLSGGPNGFGTVFKLTKQPNGSWAVSILYAFPGGSEGRGPASGVIFDKHGNLYGVTIAGGNPCTGQPAGCGTVYKLTPQPDGSWVHTVLYSLSEKDGTIQQKAGLTFDPDGNLYGFTQVGNASCCGVIYRLKPNSDGSWSEDIIHTFSGGSDGGYPIDYLTFDQEGNLYGEALHGGAHDCGIVFKLTPDSGGDWTETVVHSFCASNSDGNMPRGGLTLDAAGNLYGVTLWGGGAGAPNCSSLGCGIVFELQHQPDGSRIYRKIHTFVGTPANGPLGGLVIGKTGTLYGTTASAGPDAYGSIFQLTPNLDGSWTAKNLHLFKGYPSVYPVSTMVLDKSGTLYGTTMFSTPSLGPGTVFKLIP